MPYVRDLSIEQFEELLMAVLRRASTERARQALMARSSKFMTPEERAEALMKKHYLQAATLQKTTSDVLEICRNSLLASGSNDYKTTTRIGAISLELERRRANGQ